MKSNPSRRRGESRLSQARGVPKRLNAGVAESLPEPRYVSGRRLHVETNSCLSLARALIVGLEPPLAAVPDLHAK